MNAAAQQTYDALMGIDSKAVKSMVDARDAQEQAVAKGVAAGIGFILYGPPGTGKSTMARKVAPQVAGEPLYFPVQCSEGMSGRIVFQRTRIKRQPDGTTVTIDEPGPGLLALEQGGLLIFEEMDEASFDAVAMFTPFFTRGLADDVALEDGRKVRGQSGYAAIGTMNGEREDVHRRLVSRAMMFRVDCPSSAMFTALGTGMMRLAARLYFLAKQQNTEPAFDYRAFELYRDGVKAGISADMAALGACKGDEASASVFLNLLKLAAAPNGSGQN